MAFSSAQQMGDTVADLYNDPMCGGKRGIFQLQVDKTGARGNYMTSWGPLASREQRRTAGPELSLHFSLQIGLSGLSSWSREPRGCLLRSGVLVVENIPYCVVLSHSVESNSS